MEIKSEKQNYFNELLINKKMIHCFFKEFKKKYMMEISSKPLNLKADVFQDAFDFRIPEDFK